MPTPEPETAADRRRRTPNDFPREMDERRTAINQPTQENAQWTRVHRTDNAPELGALSLEEHERVEAARDALTHLKKSFELWVTIGQGLRTLREKADRLGGRKTFERLRQQAGLATIDKSVVTKLLHIVEHLPEVLCWRERLSERQRFDWASPGAVVKHCLVFTKPSDPNAPGKISAFAQLKRAHAESVAEIERLKKRHDGDRGRRVTRIATSRRR